MKNTSRIPEEPGRQALPRLTMTRMRQTAYPVGDLGQVVCRLWRMTPDSRRTDGSPTYALELRGLGMARMYRVGQNGARARELFELMVRYTVTPCGMADVLEELLREGSPLP